MSVKCCVLTSWAPSLPPGDDLLLIHWPFITCFSCQVSPRRAALLDLAEVNNSVRLLSGCYSLTQHPLVPVPLLTGHHVSSQAAQKTQRRGLMRQRIRASLRWWMEALMLSDERNRPHSDTITFKDLMICFCNQSMFFSVSWFVGTCEDGQKVWTSGEFMVYTCSWEVSGLLYWHVGLCLLWFRPHSVVTLETPRIYYVSHFLWIVQLFTLGEPWWDIIELDLKFVKVNLTRFCTLNIR